MNSHKTLANPRKQKSTQKKAENSTVFSKSVSSPGRSMWIVLSNGLVLLGVGKKTWCLGGTKALAASLTWSVLGSCCLVGWHLFFLRISLQKRGFLRAFLGLSMFFFLYRCFFYFRFVNFWDFLFLTLLYAGPFGYDVSF